MSDLNISYEEQEGRRRRHWWNKVIGIVIVGPIALAIGIALAAGVNVIFFNLMMEMGFTFNDMYGKDTTDVFEIWLGLGAITGPLNSLVTGSIVLYTTAEIYKWWMKLMADSNDGVSDS